MGQHHPLTRLFLVFTIAQSIFHFAFETYGHFLVGQSIPSLLADYIALSLPVLGVIGFLKWNWGPGLLCGGWGFEFCLYYRSWVWRFDNYLEGDRAPFLVESLQFLSPLLAIAAVAFVVSVYVSISFHRSRILSGLSHNLVLWTIALISGVLTGVALRLSYKLAMGLEAGDPGPMVILLGSTAAVFIGIVVRDAVSKSAAKSQMTRRE